MLRPTTIKIETTDPEVMKVMCAVSGEPLWEPVPAFGKLWYFLAINTVVSNDSVHAVIEFMSVVMVGGEETK